MKLFHNLSNQENPEENGLFQEGVNFFSLAPFSPFLLNSSTSIFIAIGESERAEHKILFHIITFLVDTASQ
jgi:hypothetical protein